MVCLVRQDFQECLEWPVKKVTGATKDILEPWVSWERMENRVILVHQAHLDQ